MKDGVTVAIKIPKDQEKGEEVLRKESDIIKDIHHPNVVQVSTDSITSVSSSSSRWSSWMGTTSPTVLDNVSAQAPLTFERMLEWTLQILDGLAPSMPRISRIMT